MKIATYGSLLQLAKDMGQNDIADLLEQTLNEEKNASEKLTELATNGINREAADRIKVIPSGLAWELQYFR